LQEPERLEIRANMQWGACLAGLAIENSMLGAAHALANPLTANFGIPHGQAVALMLPVVVRYNGRQVGWQYEELLSATPQLAGNRLLVGNRRAGADALADFLTMARQEAGLAGSLQSCQVPHNRLSELAAEAAQQWTGNFNPVPLAVAEFQQLYERAY
jgi:alcohol dehydrogenase